MNANIICDIVVVIALIVIGSIGALFIGLATAMEPENECEFCPLWGTTYTDKNGAEKSFCDNCPKRNS